MNKLMARIVAVVLAVMMLGTVSFAAPELNEAKDTITTNATDQGYKTVKALAGSTIIALAQGDDVPNSIKIDPEKIGDNKTITVMFGGLNTGIVTQTVDVPADADEPIEVDVKTTYTTQDGTTYKDVAHVANSFTVKENATATGFGYNITVSGTGFETPKTKTFTKTANISGGGTFKYDIVFLGVPAGVNISAEGFVNYNN